MVSVRRSGGAAVAVRIDAAPIELSPVFGRAAVEEEMVACVGLSWRMRDVGGGRPSPYAADGPWHLMVRERNAGDYDARGGDMDDAPAPRAPIGLEDVARVERAAGWLAMLEARPRRAGLTSMVTDGAIVAAVLRQKAASGSRVDWARVLRAVGLARGKGALPDRYARAMTWLSERVQRGAAVKP